MLSFLLFLSYLIIKIIGCLLILLIIVVLVTRVFLEPSKGVCKCEAKLHGKTVLITGGNSGLGLETAIDLARRGARVIIASRNVKKSEEAVENIKELTGNQNVEHRYLNLGKKECIIKFAEEFNRDVDRLDILVNNAGCGAVKRTTVDGIDLLMQINYVGPFTLTNLLLDKLIASKPSRIVILSSVAHRYTNLKLEDIFHCRKSPHFIRYSKTKLCDILWTRSLAKKLPSGITANVLHPGIVKTNIFDNFQPHVKKVLHYVLDLLFKSPLEGAQTVIHLCVSPELETETGGYYMDCVKIKPSRIAQDDILAEKLWIKTLELTKE